MSAHFKMRCVTDSSNFCYICGKYMPCDHDQESDDTSTVLGVKLETRIKAGRLISGLTQFGCKGNLGPLLSRKLITQAAVSV